MSEHRTKGKDLSYQSFIGKDFSGTNLSNSNLKRAIFDGVSDQKLESSYWL